MYKMFIVALIMMFTVGCSAILSDGYTPSKFPAPDEPDGPKWTYIGTEVEFKTEGTDPIDVHEFKWDFGDGTESDWDDDDESIKHRYESEGIYEVKVRERCPLYIFSSQWSDERKITVIKKKTVKVKILELFQ